MSEQADNNLFGIPVRIVPSEKLGNADWILGPPLPLEGFAVNWVRLADRPPPLYSVLAWTRSGAWYEAVWSPSDEIFYQVNTGAPLPNVTHWLDITAPVD